MIPRWLYRLMAETGMNRSVHERDGTIIGDESDLESSVSDPEALKLASPGYREEQSQRHY